MFRNAVTLFNYDEEENIYYPTLLESVELQPNYRTEFTDDGTRSKDLALLIVRYDKDSSGKFIFESSKIKYFTNPKLWNDFTTDNKSTYFTLKPGEYDFFIKGDYTSETDVNYEVFKNTYDEIFLIHGVKDFEDDLKHWEIEGY